MNGKTMFQPNTVFPGQMSYATPAYKFQAPQFDKSIISDNNSIMTTPSATIDNNMQPTVGLPKDSEYSMMRTAEVPSINTFGQVAPNTNFMQSASTVNNVQGKYDDEYNVQETSPTTYKRESVSRDDNMNTLSYTVHQADVKGCNMSYVDRVPRNTKSGKSTKIMFVNNDQCIYSKLKDNKLDINQLNLYNSLFNISPNCITDNKIEYKDLNPQNITQFNAYNFGVPMDNEHANMDVSTQYTISHASFTDSNYINNIIRCINNCQHYSMYVLTDKLIKDWNESTCFVRKSAEEIKIAEQVRDEHIRNNQTYSPIEYIYEHAITDIDRVNPKFKIVSIKSSLCDDKTSLANVSLNTVKPFVEIYNMIRNLPQTIKPEYNFNNILPDNLADIYDAKYLLNYFDNKYYKMEEYPGVPFSVINPSMTILNAKVIPKASDIYKSLGSINFTKFSSKKFTTYLKLVQYAYSTINEKLFVRCEMLHRFIIARNNLKQVITKTQDIKSLELLKQLQQVIGPNMIYGFVYGIPFNTIMLSSLAKWFTDNYKALIPYLLTALLPIAHIFMPINPLVPDNKIDASEYTIKAFDEIMRGKVYRLGDKLTAYDIMKICNPIPYIYNEYVETLYESNCQVRIGKTDYIMNGCVGFMLN